MLKRGIPQRWLDWVLLAALAVTCGALSVLQYRWTGELSRAQGEQLRSSSARQTAQFAETFNREVTEIANALIPRTEDIDRLGWAEAHIARMQAVRDRESHRLFRRVTVAAPGSDHSLHLYEMHFESAPSPVPWPFEWKSLHDRLTDVWKGGEPRGQIVDPASSLLEAPVFGGEGENRKEREWIVFELDVAYVTGTTLPELVSTFFGADAADTYMFEVRQQNGTRSRIWSLPVDAPRLETADAGATLFPARVLNIGRGRGRRDDGRWTLTVRHREGSLEAAVERSRRRNLALSLSLLGLVFATGVVLIRYTGRSRRLAEAEFQFVAGVSHELRTPLTVIRGAAHNLLSGVVHEAQPREHYLKIIVRHAEQLTAMVEQLLALAAIRKGNFSATGKASVATAVDEAIDAASADIEASQSSLDLDIAADLPPVAADPVQFRRVIQNLIVNAAVHGGVRGAIRVTAAVLPSGNLEVCVADTGPGIPAEELPQIFEPFWRGQRARESKTRGTGLGLNLVKEIVEGSGGSIRCLSEPGRGACFYITLRPASQEQKS